MKKFLVIILILFLIIETCGDIFIFISHRKAIRKEMMRAIKENIPADMLEIIKVPVFCAEGSFVLQWFKNNEFRYKGKMYDIVKKSKIQDTIYYYCINDIKEETLIEKFKNSEQSQQKICRVLNIGLIISISFLTILSDKYIFNHFPTFSINRIILVYNPVESFYKPSTPPPRT